MPALTLEHLVRNRTMSPGMAATLATAAAEHRSFLVAAAPRLAGKTTTMEATLAYAPGDTLVHRLSRAAGPRLGLPTTPDEGYLHVAEIADTGFPDYLWGAEVREVFAALEHGFALAAALHADYVDAVFDVICGANGVPDAHARRVDLVAVIRVIGDWRDPQRRALAELHEVEDVTDGVPTSRLLHRWEPDADRFVAVDPPRTIGARSGTVQALTEEFVARAEWTG